MSHRRSLRSTVTTALIAGPLALALVACGSDDDDNDDLDTTSQTAATPTPAAEETAAPTTAPSDDTDDTDDTDDNGAAGNGGDSAGAGNGDTLLAAARTALGAVGGTTLFSIDAELSGFDVTLVGDDGSESDVTVAADGRSVANGPTADNDDADDIAERQQLLSAASIDYVAAIRAAQAEIPAGTVTGASLDSDNGTATWDVQFDEDTADEQTVVIDAASGDVLGVELDD